MTAATTHAVPGDAVPSDAVPSDAATYLRHDRPLWRRLLLRTETALILAIVVALYWATAFVPYFAQPYTYTTMLQNIAPILFLILPVTLIIVTGEIDLSVGSVVGLTSVAFGMLIEGGQPLWFAAFVAVVIGGAIGALNGLLVTVVGLPSIAVTIGTLALFRGVAVGLRGQKGITQGYPADVISFLRSNVGGTPIPVAIVGFAVLAVIFAVVLHATAFGRGIFAIGRSPETASFSGVNTGRTKLILFVLSGLVAGLTGVYFTLRYSNAIGQNGSGYELQVVTAIVLGGVSIWGGRGTILGAIAGAFLIGVLSKALTLNGVTADVISIITGAALIVSVVVASVAGYLSRRRHSRAVTPAHE